MASLFYLVMPAMNVFKLSHFLASGDKGIFDVPVDDQYSYMDSLGEAESDVERSYKQFQCQFIFVSAGKRLFLSLLGLILFPFFTLVALINGFFTRGSHAVDAIAEDKGMPEIMPLELMRQYVPNTSVWQAGFCLRLKDFPFIYGLHILSKNPWFVFKIVVRVAQYSAMIARYSPKRIIVHAEYSFCSSVLTAYCHYYGVQHINVQHGEKLRYIRDAFFHFDECYVWHQHYVNLLTRQKAEPTQFRISVPPSLNFDVSKAVNEKYFADYKYYLAEYTESELRSIVESLSFVRKSGRSIKFRPHPRYSNLDLLRKYVAENEIELPESVSILDSIGNCDYAVGSFSTVLLQAYYAKKKVVLDDVTYRDRYVLLSSYGYILMNCPTLRLSSLICENR